MWARCSLHYVLCTVVPSLLEVHPRTHFLCAYRMAVRPCAALRSWQLLVVCPCAVAFSAVPVWCVGLGRFFVSCRSSVTLPSSGEARGAHVGVFSTDFACSLHCEAELERFICNVEAGLEVESGALEASGTTDGKYAMAVLSSLFP